MDKKASAPTISNVISFRNSVEPAFSVIPLLLETKLPAVKWKVVIDGQPFNDDELRGFWDRFRGKLNPGIACGRWSAGGIIVVDLDNPEAVAWAEANLPPTPMKTITRAGEHWYYRCDPAGERVPNMADVLGSKKRWEWEAKEKLGVDVICRQSKAQTEDELTREKERADEAKALAKEKLELGPCIDVRGDGGQVVAPGAIHPSGFVYRMAEPWTQGMLDSLPTFDVAWFEGQKWKRPAAKGGPVGLKKLAAKRAEKKLEAARSDTTYDQKLKRAKAWLAEVDPAVDGRGGHNKTFYAACRMACGFLLEGEDVFALLRDDYNPTCQPPWSLEELAHKVTDALDERGQNDGYMLVDRDKFVSERKVRINKETEHDSADDFLTDDLVANAELTEQGTALSKGGGGTAPPQQPPPPPSGSGGGGSPPPSSGPPGIDDDDRDVARVWQGLGVDYLNDVHGKPGEMKTQRKENGVWKVPPDTNNLDIVLRHSRFFGYDIRKNELKLQSELNGKRIDDHKVLLVKKNLDHLFQKEIAVDKVRNALEGAAARHEYEPVQDWINGLPDWDGVDRFALVPEEILGMTDVKPVHVTMFRHFMTGMVARVMDPGTKVDTILFLVGDQGAGKSKFFRLLMDGHLKGDNWFTDAPISLRDKDGRMLIGTNILVEWSEGEHAKSNKMIDNVKQFLSQQEDEFRPPYGRYVVKRPRRCVFCGTSNDSELLHDVTGSRRFYILRTGLHVDLAKTVAWREQLFAQALALYEQHEAATIGDADYEASRWWFTPVEDQARVAVVKEFQAQSVFYDDINRFVDAKAGDEQPLFTIDEVIEEGLKMPRDKKSKRVEQEVRQTLLQLGCKEQGRRMVKGVRARWWQGPSAEGVDDDLPF